MPLNVSSRLGPAHGPGPVGHILGTQPRRTESHRMPLLMGTTLGTVRGRGKKPLQRMARPAGLEPAASWFVVMGLPNCTNYYH